MQLTAIEHNRTAVQSLRALTLAVFPHLQWRHHGIGCLQGYVVEDAEPEVRIHVWSPKLVKSGMDESGDVHDHRFDLVSHVLVGAVAHEEIFPEEDGGGDWSMLSLTHARAAKDTGYHGPTSPLPGRFSVRRNSMMIQAGDSYRYPAGRFHRSPVLPSVAVTCVEKHGQTSAAARILYPTATPPVMAFGHEMDWSVVGPLLQEARDRLVVGT